MSTYFSDINSYHARDFLLNKNPLVCKLVVVVRCLTTDQCTVE